MQREPKIYEYRVTLCSGVEGEQKTLYYFNGHGFVIAYDPDAALATIQSFWNCRIRYTHSLIEWSEQSWRVQAVLRNMEKHGWTIIEQG